MNRVLVPYDFSPNSRRACALAMQGFPFGLDTQVEMLHVVDEDLYANVLASKFVPSTDAIDSYLSDEVTRIRAEIAVAHGVHSEQPKLLEPKRTIVRGRPHVMIDDHLQAQGVIGALLGGQGHGGAAEKLLGRTAQRVIRHADVPVLIVKRPHSLMPPTRLVSAVDWSSNSARALLFAARLCDEQTGLLSVLHVIDSPYLPYVQAFAHERDAHVLLDRLHDEELARLGQFIEKTLAEFSSRPVPAEQFSSRPVPAEQFSSRPVPAEQFSSRPVPAEQFSSRPVPAEQFSSRPVPAEQFPGSRDPITQAVVFGDPAITIASQAKTLLAELIVVGAHGATDLSRYLLGSTAEKLVTAAGTDILVVP